MFITLNEKYTIKKNHNNPRFTSVSDNSRVKTNPGHNIYLHLSQTHQISRNASSLIFISYRVEINCEIYSQSLNSLLVPVHGAIIAVSDSK